MVGIMMLSSAYRDKWEVEVQLYKHIYGSYGHIPTMRPKVYMGFTRGSRYLLALFKHGGIEARTLIS